MDNYIKLLITFPNQKCSLYNFFHVINNQKKTRKNKIIIMELCKYKETHQSTRKNDKIKSTRFCNCKKIIENVWK